MGYQEDTINWGDIAFIDQYLRSNQGYQYDGNELAQQWARIAKLSEEVGEVVNQFIILTGQNPRKSQQTHGAAWEKLYDEIGDVIITGILALMEMIRDDTAARWVIRQRIQTISRRLLALPRSDEVSP